MNYEEMNFEEMSFEELQKTVQEMFAKLAKEKERAKTYTEAQMIEEIKKYGLKEKYGIFIVNEGEFHHIENSGFIIKKNDGNFEVVITGERGIIISKTQKETINEAMYILVSKLCYEKSKEEYFQQKSKSR